MGCRWLFLSILLANSAAAIPTATLKTVETTVKLDGAVFTGITTGDVTHFLGIPFGKPPYVHTLSNSF
jgi:hypothetical protein